MRPGSTPGSSTLHSHRITVTCNTTAEKWNRVPEAENAFSESHKLCTQRGVGHPVLLLELRPFFRRACLTKSVSLNSVRRQVSSK